MGAQGLFALTQSLCPHTEGNAQTTSPRATAPHGGPMRFEAVRAMLGFFSPGFLEYREHGGEAGGRKGTG